MSLSVYFLYYISICCFFFFFFQADDGIRDWSVTGVQTCALPICDDRKAMAWASGCPFVGRSSRRIMDGFGRSPIKDAASRFVLNYQSSRSLHHEQSKRRGLSSG